jgi:hypothetical protein
MADTKEHPIQSNGNGGKAALVQWLLGIVLPAMIVGVAALAAKVYADSERVRACEIQGATLEKQLDGINAKLDRLLERR